MAKKIEPRYECIAYLSVEADLNVVDRLENKQLKYIKEYAKAHNIKVVGVMRRHGFWRRSCTGRPVPCQCQRFGPPGPSGSFRRGRQSCPEASP